MRDAIDSPAWGELGEWVSALPEQRHVCVWWTRGRWSVALYEHAPLPSTAILASADTYGQTDEDLAVVVRRALEHIEGNRAARRAAAIAQLRELAGE